MKSADLEAEYRLAVRSLKTEDAVELVDQLGISYFLVLIHQMVGILPIRLDKSGWQWEPAEEGPLAYITPVRMDRANTALSLEAWGTPRCGELVDLIAWDPRHPRRWALRTAALPWLGCVPYGEPFPALIRTAPLSWLQADCDGLVLLTRDPPTLRSIFDDFEYGIECNSERFATRLNNLLRTPVANPSRVRVVPAGARARGTRAREGNHTPLVEEGNYTPLREEE